MQEWEPISLDELYIEILKIEKNLSGELKNFWNLIKIDPIKWKEREFGEMGGGFWVVAICGSQVIWYNDIEEGFNISTYKIFGEIEKYWCNQDELIWSVTKLYEMIKSGQYLIRGSRGIQESLQ